MNNTAGMVELPQLHSNRFSSQKILGSGKLKGLVASLPQSDQAKLKNYLISSVNRTKQQHDVSLRTYRLSFQTEMQSSAKKMVIKDFKLINDSAIRRANLRSMNRDSAAQDYVVAEEMLKGVEGGKVDLAKRKELGKQLDNKFRIVRGKGQRIPDSAIKRYQGYLRMILSTKSGRKLANIRDTGWLPIVLINESYMNSSYGHGTVQINIHPSQSKRYAKAFGRNTYVQLGGIRTLAHELTHAYYWDTGSKSMKKGEEVQAMTLANRIMREIYGLDAGERKNYAATSPEFFPDEVTILK